MKREIIVDGDVAYVPLSRGCQAIIDVQDIELVRGVNWCAHADSSRGNTLYARNSRRGAMHRIIMGVDGRDTQVDHIDGNGLNNRRSNLRVCSNAENQRNRRLHRDNKSGLKGVSWHRPSSKWAAQIRIDGKKTYLGTFDEKEMAHAAYCAAAATHHGEFANYGTPFAIP